MDTIDTFIEELNKLNQQLEVLQRTEKQLDDYLGVHPKTNDCMKEDRKKIYNINTNTSNLIKVKKEILKGQGVVIDLIASLVIATK